MKCYGDYLLLLLNQSCIDWHAIDIPSVITIPLLVDTFPSHIPLPLDMQLNYSSD